MRIGIDVGGTKIEGLTLSTDGRELARHRVATPTVYDAVLAAIVELVARLEAGQTAKATVGIGTPGVLHPGRRVMLNSNLTCLNDRPLDRDLAVAPNTTSAAA
jgi:fructokinase